MVGEKPFSVETIFQGQLLKNQKRIDHIFFSEGTYQIEVHDLDGKTFWPFLHITDDGMVKERFCSCNGLVEGCAHQAAAWLKIFENQSSPLHVRFRKSLWNQLGQIGASRHGYKVKNLKGNLEVGFEAFSKTRKPLFFLKPLNTAGKKYLKEVLINRKVESEESSLKFSNLSAQELALWKEGRPSDFLQYELSFWSDLAKWWMLLQDEGKEYQIHFSHQQVLPEEIEVLFPDVQFTFYLAEANWNKIIPSLTTLSSPLKTYEFSHEQIRQITYDPTEKTLHLDIHLEEEVFEEEKIYSIGEWIFVRGKGFYPSQLDPLLKKTIIPSTQIGEFLTKHTHVVEKYLLGTTLHPTPVPVGYVLFFDATYSLHINCYLFEKGDLQSPNASAFIPWVYLDGFYRLDNLLSDQLQLVLPPKEVSRFVSKHRNWLQFYPGFQTHSFSAPSQLTYSLLEKGLSFASKVEIVKQNEESFDFDDWFYVKGSGFYSKAKGDGIALKGLFIPIEELPKFIDAHQEELENVAYFFASRSPIKKSGIAVLLDRDNHIFVEPRYTFFSLNPKVKILGSYTYVEGEGFYKIPPHLLIPEPYTKKKFIEQDMEPYFISYEMEILKSFLIEVAPQLRKPQRLLLEVNSIERDPSSSWSIELEYVSEIGRVDIGTLWNALHEGKSYLFSPAGLIFFKHPRYNWLRGLSKKEALQGEKRVQLSMLEWMRLFTFEEMEPPRDYKNLQLWNELKTFKTDTPFNLDGLKSELRNYQQSGFRWLWFLYCYGLSGLLCDEMGLGKTHQAMALLAAAYNEKKGQKFLVVCPTTVIFHWELLIKKYLPHFRVYLYYGTQRSEIDSHSTYDLLLTSYGTLRSNKAVFERKSFAIAIFDEIQVAKNSSSQTHKILKLISASVRIGLTGTPIENHLFDLKSLFDVILPGYLPSQTAYKDLFINPIEKQQDVEKKQLLARLIKPFVLRRKKNEVLLELPEKVETIAYAPMSEEQKRLYQEVSRFFKEQLLQELKDTSQPIPYLHIFSLLTKLKQICDHPALFKKDIDNYAQHSSGKWDLFIELLQEIQENEQKVVVFSQYLGMLDIIEKYLAEHRIGFASLRGITKNRKKQVLKFQKDPQCGVFVGSLQAAGVGIDLISASVIIHYDRWWNPAKENQATDRVHRLGQTRGVQVFKMVTKGSIEEHIHLLIEKKLTLIEEFIGSDDQDHLKFFSREELTEIFSLIGSFS